MILEILQKLFWKKIKEETLLEEREFQATMKYIVEALKERGYDPYAQITGYVTENEPTYITSYKGARQLILTLDIEQVKQFLKGMQ